MTDAAAVRPPLDPAVLARAAPWRVEVVDEATSTNLLLAERARAGAQEGLVIVAEHQIAGRGRLDRVWEAPARAGLTFSVLLRPQVAATAWPWLPLLSGLAVAHAVQASGATAELKWPNDVLIGDRKLAGMLVERIETGPGPAAIVGIGLNVSTGTDELPVPTATSLLLSGVSVDRSELLVLLLSTLREEYAAWPGDDQGAGLRSSYAALCVTARGQSVQARLPSGEVVLGEGYGIDAGGGLLIRTGGGSITLTAGDVIHVRPRDQ